MSAPRLPSLAEFRSALIVKPSSLGDIVHTLPAVAVIHRAFPHLRLRWLANPEWMPLLEGSPLLSEVIPFPRKSFRGAGLLTKAPKWAAEWRQMPREMPEVVLDFQGLLRSALIARTRGSRPIVGLSDAREGAPLFYDFTLPVNSRAHAVDRYLALPEAFGLDISDAGLSVPLPEGKRPEGWPEAQGFVVVHPWSRGQGKSLSTEALRALCQDLAPCPVVLVGMSGMERAPAADHIIDFSNRTTLAELLWILRLAQFVISVDSGPMHIAAAVNDRTLGLHTWSDPRRVGPYNPRAWVWKAGHIARWRDLAAAPCEVEQAIGVAEARVIARFIIEEIEKH
jgi:ADP-heptose:LPS heptosyltransferase